MKVTTALSLALVSLVAVATAGIPQAIAGTITNHSGTICKNYSRGDVGYIDYLASGARSSKSSSTQLICPLVRSTTRSYGAYVYVDVYHSGSNTTSCTLYSYSWTGSLKGSTSGSTTGSGTRHISLYLGSGKSDTWSDYAVLCSVPGSYAGRIMGVDLNEL